MRSGYLPISCFFLLMAVLVASAFCPWLIAAVVGIAIGLAAWFLLRVTRKDPAFGGTLSAFSLLTSSPDPMAGIGTSNFPNLRPLPDFDSMHGETFPFGSTTAERANRG